MKPTEAVYKKAARECPETWCTYCSIRNIAEPPLFICDWLDYISLNYNPSGDEPCLAVDWEDCLHNKTREVEK